jgi:hypothetical protein
VPGLRTRDDYDRAIAVTREVVHAWDPYDLIAGGAPADEFDDEIARMVARLPKIADPATAGQHVEDIFTAQFGRGVLDRKEADAIGERWFAALRQAGLLTDA